MSLFNYIVVFFCFVYGAAGQETFYAEECLYQENKEPICATFHHYTVRQCCFFCGPKHHYINGSSSSNGYTISKYFLGRCLYDPEEEERDNFFDTVEEGRSIAFLPRYIQHCCWYCGLTPRTYDFVCNKSSVWSLPSIRSPPGNNDCAGGYCRQISLSDQSSWVCD